MGRVRKEEMNQEELASNLTDLTITDFKNLFIKAILPVYSRFT